MPVPRRADPVSGGPGSDVRPLPPSGPVTQHVALLSAERHTTYCVLPLPRDAARRAEKGRFAYFLAVVHFRKVVIFEKVGSDGNGSPVI